VLRRSHVLIMHLMSRNNSRISMSRLPRAELMLSCWSVVFFLLTLLCVYLYEYLSCPLLIPQYCSTIVDISLPRTRALQRKRTRGTGKSSLLHSLNLISKGQSISLQGNYMSSYSMDCKPRNASRSMLTLPSASGSPPRLPYTTNIGLERLIRIANISVP
jgi:hypothetical protein